MKCKYHRMLYAVITLDVNGKERDRYYKQRSFKMAIAFGRELRSDGVKNGLRIVRYCPNCDYWEKIQDI